MTSEARELQPRDSREAVIAGLVPAIHAVMLHKTAGDKRLRECRTFADIFDSMRRQVRPHSRTGVSNYPGSPEVAPQRLEIIESAPGTGNYALDLAKRIWDNSVIGEDQ